MYKHHEMVCSFEGPSKHKIESIYAQTYRKQNLITSSREKERERENEINYDKTVQANYTEENPFKKYSIVPRDRKIHSKLDRFAFKV